MKNWHSDNGFKTYSTIDFEGRLNSFSMISLWVSQFWGKVLTSTCVVLRPIAFKEQLIWLFYPVLMLEKKVKWWSQLSAVIIYCYWLQRLVVTALKLVDTKCDNYLLTLNCTEAMLLATNNLEIFLAEEFRLSNKCFIMDVIQTNFWRNTEQFLAWYLCQKGSSGSGHWPKCLWLLNWKAA